MRKLIFTTAFLTIALFGYLIAMIFSLITYKSYMASQQTKAQDQLAYAALPTLGTGISAEIITNDGRAEAIRQFFSKYDSPLEPYAEDVIKAADEYNIDFRLVPAIAMQESGLCKTIPENSYNCWGYGIYGGKVLRFKDFKEGIYTVSKGLGTKYIGQGLVTPEQIEEDYTPPSKGSWANGVNHFIGKLQ